MLGIVMVTVMVVVWLLSLFVVLVTTAVLLPICSFYVWCLANIVVT